MEEIIEEMKVYYAKAVENGDSLTSASWDWEEGYLLSYAEVKTIIDYIENQK